MVATKAGLLAAKAGPGRTVSVIGGNATQSAEEFVLVLPRLDGQAVGAGPDHQSSADHPRLLLHFARCQRWCWHLNGDGPRFHTEPNQEPQEPKDDLGDKGDHGRQ
jgi:hypothetical protein